MKILLNKPEFLSREGLKEVLLKAGPHAKFIGSWAVRTKDNNWSDFPVDIVYIPNPDISGFPGILTGYWREYSGMFMKGNVESSFKGDNTYINCLVEDNVVYVSKFRHDFVKTPEEKYIDGGRDYTRTNCALFNSLSFDLVTGQFLLSTPKNHGYSIVEIEYDYS